uniref:FHA domain-containing protein n=1 Tax=Panagrolaimus sp. ES5 TaxID=591445 RepID=A0AC34G412_9BILA
MVSRLHAEITAEPDSEDPTKFQRYSIADRSLNGTYVNDRRAPTVSGELYLKKGDVIKFGHVNGASYKPGEYAIGNESEFIFTFEPAYEGMEYIGHTPDGNRIERKGPQAYIHLGAHSLLPHEFDLFSLVPKREADLSVIPYGTRINPEQKRVEYIQPHSQLVTKSSTDPKQQQQHSNEQQQQPITSVHPGTFGTTSISIPGVSNPAIIPNMANF